MDTIEMEYYFIMIRVVLSLKIYGKKFMISSSKNIRAGDSRRNVKIN